MDISSRIHNAKPLISIPRYIIAPFIYLPSHAHPPQEKRNGTVIRPQCRCVDDSLTCFAPGNFLLGGRVLERDDIFEFGLQTMEGCWHAYNVTPTGISPESIALCPYPPRPSGRLGLVGWFCVSFILLWGRG
jgi:hypothetical protein